MLVAICYNPLSEQDVISESDINAQVDAVKESLENLGHRHATIECGLNLAEMKWTLEKVRPDVIFNLVDAVEGYDSLLNLPLRVWETMGIPYVGATAESLELTTSKVLTKTLISRAALPTPSWRILDDQVSFGSTRKWILKNVFDHGSRDMDDESVFVADAKVVQEKLWKRIQKTGRPTFAEEFVDGRDISVAILCGPMGMEILPPTEIDFSRFPEDKPRIVGFNAKWQKNTFEYNNTPILYDFAKDVNLLNKLYRLASKCVWLFGLTGWVRIDFRVDEDEKPWILEVNGNSCLSPDAGFQATLKNAGISFDTAIQRILDDAFSRQRRSYGKSQVQ